MLTFYQIANASAFSIDPEIDAPEETTTEFFTQPEIETSLSEEPEARLFFTQAFKTILQTVGTSTFSTWPSCYVTVAVAPAVVPLCLSTALTGRKKRDAVILESPKVEVNGVVYDFAAFISASKVKV